MRTSRREFVRQGASAFVAAAPFIRLIRLPIAPRRRLRPARLAVITDLHHGLAPDALDRFRAFLAAASRGRFDAMLQMGDFCYSDAGAADCLALWRAVRAPRMSILGNHDMDKCDKATATRAFGMPTRYYARTIGGYRFVVLDLNNFRKDGKIVPYANGNYFTDNATFNCADPEQLGWLHRELLRADRPVIILSHQPLGFADIGQPLPPEQVEVFAVIDDAGRANPAGAVAACLSGHLHVDRLEHVGNVPCLLVNSASYFWSSGMYPYTNPLYAFLEFTVDGMLKVEGRSGEFVKPPPLASATVIGRSAVISDRTVRAAVNAVTHE
jgi:predicted phosphodiesterase